jgi:hypothetical protein
MTLMSELGPRAREILRSGRELDRPTDADRDRIENALRERLGAALLLAESSKALPVPRPRWPFMTGGLVGVGLLGGALFFATRQPSATANAPRAAATASAVVATSSASPIESAVELPPAEPARPAALVSSDRSTASARPAEDRLAQEVALLARATSSLHAGHPAEALKALDEYQRRFPKGLLAEERRAARAQALCSLGRQSEAQSELARLAPQSLAAARAKQVCDARSASKK